MSAYSRITGRPLLYTYASIKTLHRPPRAIDFGKARTRLNYQQRPLEQTVRDLYAWLRSETDYLTPPSL